MANGLLCNFSAANRGEKSRHERKRKTKAILIFTASIVVSGKYHPLLRSLGNIYQLPLRRPILNTAGFLEVTMFEGRSLIFHISLASSGLADSC